MVDTVFTFRKILFEGAMQSNIGWRIAQLGAVILFILVFGYVVWTLMSGTSAI